MLGSTIKLAFKVLGRRKFFTFVSLFGVGFTLMVLIVAVAVLDHTLGAGPPEVNQDRTLMVQHTRLSGHDSSSGANVGQKFFTDFLQDLPGTERISRFTNGGRVTSRLGGNRHSVKRTDGNYWKILRFDFLEGGPFSDDDDRQRRFVAVISRSTAIEQFGPGPVVGKTIELDGQRYSVVGVVEDVSPLRKVGFADIWAPLSTEKGIPPRPEWLGSGTALVLLNSAAAIPLAKQTLRERLERFTSPDPRVWTRLLAPLETRFESVARDLFGDNADDGQHAGTLWAVLFALAACFMLLPTVNLMNLNVSRILERASEIGVRKSFGATAHTLVAQFLVENLVLTLLGAIFGTALAAVVLRGLTVADLLPHADLQISAKVAAIGAALAVVFGLVSGVYPAWRMSRLHPVQALKGGER